MMQVTVISANYFGLLYLDANTAKLRIIATIHPIWKVVKDCV